MSLTYRTFLLSSLITILGCVAHAQNSTPISPADPMSPEKGSMTSRREAAVGSPEAEMMERRKLKYEEKAHQENLERAREVAQLGAELRDAYARNQSLSHEDGKKLERLEKLTRRIRNDAGGSSSDEKTENAPSRLEVALARVVEMSESLRKTIEKTPRHVISALVIERANDLLDVIHYVRSFTPSVSK